MELRHLRCFLEVAEELHFGRAAAGRMPTEEARQVLARLEQAVQWTQRADRVEEGWLVIGFVASATHMVRPQILRAFREQFLQVELGLYNMTTAAQAAALHANRIQIGFIRPSVKYCGFTAEVIAQEPTLAALS